jgi:hypothetical protein
LRPLVKERERTLEEEYFRKKDEKLIEKLRERGKLEEIAEALTKSCGSTATISCAGSWRSG